MLTTLTQRNLSSFTLKYKFINRKLSLYIDIAAGHKLFGDVSIELSNCKSVNIYNSLGVLVENVFNGTFVFKATSSTRLEYSIGCNSGLPQSIDEVSVPSNGSAIEARVNNISIGIPSGKYIFKLIETNLTDFDGALITFKELDIVSVGETSFNGLTDQFDQVDGDVNQGIDNEELTFNFNAVMSLSSIGADTNIPISYIKV